VKKGRFTALHGEFFWGLKGFSPLTVTVVEQNRFSIVTSVEDLVSALSAGRTPPTKLPSDLLSPDGSV